MTNLTTEELLATLNAPLPASKEAEEGMISCLFFNPNWCEQAPPAEQFYHPSRRLIYSTIINQFNKGLPVDVMAITHVFREMGKLDEVGGPHYISDLYSFAILQSHFSYYSEILKRNYQFRCMIHACAAGIHAIRRFNESEDVSAMDILGGVQKAVNEAILDDGSPDVEFRPLPDIIHAVVDQMEDRAKNPGRIPGVSTGFLKLDEYSGGLEDGTLTVIAAKPSEGKSALCRQIVENACLNDHLCDIFTVEMTDIQEVTRLLCSQAGVDAQNMKLGMLTRGEQLSLTAKMAKVAQWNLRVIDSANLTIEKICRAVIRRSKQRKPGQKYIVVIDYIQICSTAENTANREREVAHITKTAKQCAKATGACFLMPSQLNDANEARESRAIEQDADNFWMIVDVEDKEPKKPWQKKKEDEPTDDRDLFLKKTRNGQRRKRVPLRANMRYFRFEPRGTEES